MHLTFEMNIRAFLILWFVNYSAAQDANCDFVQYITTGTVQTISSPRYPQNYPPGVQCRYIAVCAAGYNCRLDCPVISLPQSPSCSMDRFLVSRSGDLQLNAAESYCGVGTLSNIVSTGQRLTLGLIASFSSPGGRFFCEVRAQRASTGTPCSCGVRRQDRIVGGQETGVNEYPMMVGVVDLDIRQIKCGAVIISPEYILTAAHCVSSRTIANTAVIVGEHNINVGDSPATTPYPVERFIIHPLYNSANYDYDIAIIKVKGIIAFSDRVGPVCLPFKYQNFDFTGKKLTLLGWGTLVPGGPTSPALRKVDVDVISQTSCRTMVSTLTNRQMCTLTPGKDACQDDSGGPSLFTDPTTGLLFCAGMVSSGRFCASPTDPGIHTRVNSVLDWIVSNAPYNYCPK